MIKPEQLAASGSEHSQQCALFCWAANNQAKYPQLKWMHSSGNGIFTTSGHKAKEKAAGLKNGVPDICLPMPMQLRQDYCYYGLYIELKIPKRRTEKNGGCSDEQLEWLAFLNSQGHKAVVCYGWEEARDVIIKYLEG